MFNINIHKYKPYAVARIRGNKDAPGLSGEIYFYQKRSFVLISVSISGLPLNESGFYGFHIHEGDSCEGDDFQNTGGHFNPQQLTHPAHAGDLPPLIKCNNGAYMVIATDRFKVTDIIGKTVVIHDTADDFTTQPSGNSGNKIGCGSVVRIK